MPRGSGASTGPDGAYRIAGIPSGAYVVLATAWELGYEAEFYPDARSPEEATPVPVTAPDETAGIDFALAEARPLDGAIAGRVVAEESGAPLGGTVVVAVSLDGHAGFAVADSSGYYWIPALLAADYVVLAAASGRMGEFYDNVLAWEEATPVAVSGPVSGIDFALAALGFGPGVIRGRVTDPRGGPLAQVWIYAEPLDGQGSAGFATSGADGSYTITGLAAGRYRVRATRPGMATAYHAGDRGIEVGQSPASGIDIVLGLAAPPAAGLGVQPNVPNPFRDATAIRLAVDRAGVTIAIDLYDVRGRHLRRLNTRVERPGLVEVPWDGRDAAGRLAPSGVYLYRASGGGKVVSGRLVLLR